MTDHEETSDANLSKTLGAGGVGVAATSYIIASSTLVSDLTGWLGNGWTFAGSLLAAFLLNLLLCLSVAELGASFPRCGAIYSFTEAVFGRFRFRRTLAVFAAVVMMGTTVLAGASEISSGALSLRALLPASIDLRLLIVALVVVGVVPHVLGLRTVVFVSLIALVLMLALRWGFGFVGFIGMTNLGDWSAANIEHHGAVDWKSVTAGLGLAFWTFVGAEAVAPLAEETKTRRALLDGMIGALLLVAFTSSIMGVGIAGTQTTDAWASVITSERACHGECVHIAVGAALLGEPGAMLMALTAVISACSTVIIGIGGFARVMHGVARDAGGAGILSRWLGRSVNGAPPRAAFLATGALVATPALFHQQVIGWVLPAALLWMLLYVAYHVLVLIDRHLAPDRPRPFRTPLAVPLAGAIATTVAIPFVFGQVEALGLLQRVVVVLLGAAVVTVGLFATERQRTTDEE